MSKVLHKHKNTQTHYLLMIDIFDISGSFQKYLFDRLIEA